MLPRCGCGPYGWHFSCGVIPGCFHQNGCFHRTTEKQYHVGLARQECKTQGVSQQKYGGKGCGDNHTTARNNKKCKPRKLAIDSIDLNYVG